MPKQINRYQNPAIIEHLAHQYVLGLLSPQVRAKTEKLALTNEALLTQINYWQQRFSYLDKQTDELAPAAQTWQNIAQIFNDEQQTTAPANNKTLAWLAPLFSFKQLASALAFSAIILLSVYFIKPLQHNDPLSYVAVLTDKNNQAQLVASTYGESKKLVLNVINAPNINNEQDLEVWVISKTDQQARSLGVIPRNKKLIEKQLTTPQWRLIKDSDSLIVTIEENGGSAIGEPSDLIVSRGLCVRLKEWKNNA